MDYTGVQQSDPIGAPETQWRMTRWQAAASSAQGQSPFASAITQQAHKSDRE
jgi:hypothetical protein